MIMQNIVDAVKRLKSQLVEGESLTALETGTIRSYEEKHYSTFHIGEALGDRGVLASLDIEPNSIKISRDICKNLNNITWYHGDSVEVIPKICKSMDLVGYKFDFVLLDSVNDGAHILKEFLLVVPHMRVGGILIIDDSGVDISGEKLDPQNSHQKKGIGVWKFLMDNDIPFEIKKIPSGRGNNLILTITEELKAAIFSK